MKRATHITHIPLILFLKAFEPGSNTTSFSSGVQIMATSLALICTDGLIYNGDAFFWQRSAEKCIPADHAIKTVWNGMI